MTTTGPYEAERLAELLRALPPAPEGWVRAAQELPRSRRALDDIVARAVADQEFRQALTDAPARGLRAPVASARRAQAPPRLRRVDLPLIFGWGRNPPTG